MKRSKGFTIIELLTVITIITLLIGITAPAIRQAKNIAADLQQRSILSKDYTIGLELFSMENDWDYPDSKELGTTRMTTGAHHLAEALIGRDLNGYSSKSSWDAEADNTLPFSPYDLAIYSSIYRDEVYIEDEDPMAFQISQIYDDVALTALSIPIRAYGGSYDYNGAATANRDSAYVFTDIYKKNKVVMPDYGQVGFTVPGETVKVGSPILYFKAKDTKIYDTTATSLIDRTSNVFNYDDNIAILELGRIDDQEIHPYYDNGNAPNTASEDFYENLINHNIPAVGVDPIPYNKNSYILLSAGRDGLYGTKDDITNIKKR